MESNGMMPECMFGTDNNFNDIYFSVIIPVYNTESYLRECFDSVLCQTYKRFEVLLCADEYSKDGSVAVCEKYAARDKHIKLIRYYKKGASEARNIGLDAARGSHVIFLDSDDYWLDNTALKGLADIIGESDPDIILWNLRALQKNGKLSPPIIQAFDYDTVNGKSYEYAVATLNRNNAFTDLVYNKCVRRDIIEVNMLRFPEKIINGEDAIWCTELLLYARSFWMYDNPFYVRRYRDDSAVSSPEFLGDFKSRADYFARYYYMRLDEPYKTAILTHCANSYIHSLVKKDNFSKKDWRRIKQMRGYLRYDAFYKVKRINLFYCIFGFNATVSVLRFRKYMKTKLNDMAERVGQWRRQD